MSTELNTYPVFHYRFWIAFGIHMRPYLLFLSGVAGFAGIAMANEGATCSATCYMGMLAFFLAYGFGQALTDSFQVDTDKLSAPYRPLSQGIVKAREVRTVAFIGLLSLGGILIALNLYNLLFCGLSIFGLATYSYIKRHFWWGGPFYNAWIVALLPIMGYLVVSGSDFSALSIPELGKLILLAFFAYSNFVLIGYLKDIRADKATAYKTFPVVFGWNASVWVGDVFALLSCGLVLSLTISSPLALGTAILGILIALAGQLYAHFTKDKSEKNATFPITATVRSFILWHLAVALVFQPSWWIFALIFYVLFELVLKLRPMREQI